MLLFNCISIAVNENVILELSLGLKDSYEYLDSIKTSKLVNYLVYFILMFLRQFPIQGVKIRLDMK